MNLVWNRPLGPRAVPPDDVGDLRERVPGLLPDAPGQACERGRIQRRAAEQHRAAHLYPDD